MFTASTPAPGFKRAAIDWLLTHGTCESMTNSTGLALAYLSVYGVDYDATEAPDFTTVAIDSGDTDNGAIYGEAFACTVYSTNPDFAGQDTWQRHDGFEFWVGKDDIMRVMLSQMIAGVIAAAETGDNEWKARANQSEVERYERHIAAEAERARRAAEKVTSK